MSGDELWELFRETGDPVCWLWSRRAEEAGDDEDDPAAG